MTQQYTDAPMDHLYRLIQYVFSDEPKNFKEQDEPANHIWHHIKAVQQWWSKQEFGDPDFFPITSTYSDGGEISPFKEQSA
jgi:hypothetical protein